MSVTDQLLENNALYAESFTCGELPLAPAKRVAVVACMDARIVPTRALGLNEGDAHIIRNAGGLITEDAMRSLVISQWLAQTREIILIHHTDCGLFKTDGAEFKRMLEEETGVESPWSFTGCDDLEDSVRESIKAIKTSPFLRYKDSVRGFIYQVESGKLVEVT